MIHVVQRGETLAGIAAQYGVSPVLLQYQNMMENPNRLVVGQTLLVLIPAETYTVRSGDTLWSLSAQVGVSLRQIYRLNPWLHSREGLYEGQTVVLAYTERPTESKLVGGYTYPQIDTGLLRSVLPYLTTVLPFAYGFTTEGVVIPIDDDEILLMARESGTAAAMVLAPVSTEGVFNNALITSVLRDTVKRQRLIDEVMRTVEAKGFHGVDLDFEYVRREDSDLYVGFAAELAERLHAAGRYLSAALAPKVYAEQRGLLYEGHDYRRLGEVLDLTLLMTYEWGYTYGPPLAVAPLYEVRRVLEYGLTEIPAEKILMGIPNYGYDWTLPYRQGGMARSISNPRAVELAWQYGAEIQYDNAAQAPFFYYTTPEGADHVVWFEDLRSMRAKYDLCAELGLRGLTFWTVTRPFPANFLMLATRFDTEQAANLYSVQPTANRVI